MHGGRLKMSILKTSTTVQQSISASKQIQLLDKVVSVFLGKTLKNVVKMTLLSVLLPEKSSTSKFVCTQGSTTFFIDQLDIVQVSTNLCCDAK